MKIDLKYKNKKINIEVKECNWFNMFRGLMFRRRENSPALLLFNFKKPGILKIHSFFCKKFLAVWLDDKNNVIEKKVVYPWKICVIPRGKFSKLVEIPYNKKYRREIRLLVES